MAISVVLVEDSNQIREVIEDLLRHVGQYKVVGRAGTEMEATEWLQEHKSTWNLAVVDLVLREGSGFNLVRRFREEHPDGRIIVLSDYATPRIKIRCVEFGADAAFTKGEIKAFANYLMTRAMPAGGAAAA